MKQILTVCLRLDSCLADFGNVLRNKAFLSKSMASPYEISFSAFSIK